MKNVSISYRDEHGAYVIHVPSKGALITVRPDGTILVHDRDGYHRFEHASLTFQWAG